MTFSLFFLGAEQPTWATVLADEGVDNVGLSYWSLAKRIDPVKVDLAKRLDGFNVLLESGGYQAHKSPQALSVGEWQDYAEGYEAFIDRNLATISMVTELDCPALGPAWMMARRHAFYDMLPEHVSFLPVWRPEQGERTLADLIERYERVSIVASVFDDRGSTVAAKLMSERRRHPGLLLHGSALTKPEVVETLPFTSAASTSWLSPQRFGDTIVWDGQRLVRYPMRYKDRRTSHRADFERAGFDPDKICADNAKELTRFTIWSWRQFEEHVNKQSSPAASSNPTPVTEVVSISSTPQIAVAGSTDAVVVPAKDRETTVLPIMGIVQADDVEVEGEGKSAQLTITGTSMRACNTCVVGPDCPGYRPGYKCAYSMPVECRTKAQRAAIMNGMHTIQVQRIGILRLREEVMGGYPDPNLSRELKLLTDMMAAQAEMEDDSDFFEMHFKGRRGGATGAFGKIFGSDAAAAQGVLPAGGYDKDDVDQVLAAGTGVIR